MKVIRYSKSDVEKLITDDLKKQGHDDPSVFIHTMGVTAMVEEEEDVLETKEEKPSQS